MARTVTIDGVDYRYAYDFGVILALERLINNLKIDEAGKMFTNTVVHYSCLVGDDRFTMSLDEFVGKLQTKAVVDQLNDALNSEYARWSGEQQILPVEGEKKVSKADKSKKK